MFLKKLKFTLLLFLLGLPFLLPGFAHAASQSGIVDNSKQVYYKAQVLQILEQGEQQMQGFKNAYQTLKIQITEGPDRGKTITLTQGKDTTILPQNLVRRDDIIILTMTTAAPSGKPRYIIYDKYRLDHLLVILAVFLVAIFLIAGLRGLGSLLGLLISLIIILFFIIPQILAGHNPTLVSLFGSIIILFITTYLAHGVSRQTTVALLSTFVALLLTVVIANFFVNFADLSGLNDETSMLIFGPTSHINLKGLLLAGVIIGTLGALNDITTSQAAAVFELAKTDAKLKFDQLFTKGLRIGREHIVSMVNTLVLAYAGSSLILFIFIVLNPAGVPSWVFINNELISDEIVRTLAGSIGLLLVVPIVTAISAFACTNPVLKSKKFSYT